MEIKDMTTVDIEVRSAEIEKEIAEGGDVETLSAEVEALEERKAQIEKEAEERKALLNEVAKTSKEVEPLRKEKDMEELRNSKQYIDAYARFIKTGDDRECRTLLTESATGDDAVLPVPQFVADILHAELRSDIVDGFRKMRAKGNVSVPVEINAPAAAIHTEGGAAVEEEDLKIINVMLTPITYKKWVGISDEALDVELMDSRSYLEYIFDEIARGIMKARENQFFNEVNTAVQTEMVVEVGTANAAAADFVNARAQLNADARDLVAIVTPTAYAAYRALQLSASYPIDVFDGMKVIVRDFPSSFTGIRAIVGDLRGYMENLPNGEEIQFKKDETTLMTSDIVRVLGRLPASVGLVGYKYFARIGIQGE